MFSSRIPKRKSLIYLTAVLVAACLVSVGLAAISIAAYYTGQEIEERAADQLDDLINTTESALSIACFTGDDALAREVVAGLLKNRSVLKVKVQSLGSRDLRTTDRLLAESIQRGRNASAVKYSVERKVYSPFSETEPVGLVSAALDPAYTQAEVRRGVQSVVIQLAVLLAVMTAIILYVMLNRVVRPVRAMSRQLHEMDVLKGEKLLLPDRSGFELEQLAIDINQMAGALVASIAEEKILRLKVAVDEAKYRAIFDHAESGLFVLSADGQIESTNQAFRRLLQCEGDAPENFAQLSLHLPCSFDEIKACCFVRREQYSGEVKLDTQAQPIFLRLILTPLQNGSAQGVIFDVTAEKLAESAALDLALKDSLTGLLNRPALEQALEKMLAECDQSGPVYFGFLQIGIDGFSKINQALGVALGDEVLQTAARRIKSVIKSTDYLARVGGDEFAIILLSPKSREGVEGVAKRIQNSMSRTYEIGAAPITLRPSIGLALCPEHGNSKADLMRHAELAMHWAKSAGGGRSVFFEQGMAEAAEYRRSLEVDIQMALERNEFFVVYQPIVGVDDGKLRGAEALIRWQHPQRGLIVPDQFIPIAEESGLIVSIGRWMLDEVVKQLKVWQQFNESLYVSVNVSGRQIPDGLTAADVEQVLARHAVRPSNLVLEITEGILLEDVDSACAWLASIRALGVKVYLDDFGTGYSSLSYLKRFPVDSVKIDRSFVRELADSLSDQALVRAILGMASSLGLTVVAEGVEGEAQRDVLQTLGCQSAQGYLYSRPIPAKDFSALALFNAP